MHEPSVGEVIAVVSLANSMFVSTMVVEPEHSIVIEVLSSRSDRVGQVEYAAGDAQKAE